jgi:hypothetical protein
VKVRVARRAPQHRRDTDATLFRRVAETHALLAGVPRNTLLCTIVKSYQKPRFLITLLERV